MNFESELDVRSAMLAVGVVVAIAFIWVGLLVDRYKRYDLIAGYHRATHAVKTQYDIDGLAKHVGNGLETLGVLIFIAAVFGYFGLDGWLIGTMVPFTLIALIIPLGARKFMPERQRMLVESPEDVHHHFLRQVLPENAYAWLESKTRQWLIECNECGHRRDYWEAGGIRHGVGQPKNWRPCGACAGWHWHTIRKKTPAELISLCNPEPDSE